MVSHLFTCEPPTTSSLADARRLLDDTNTSLADVDRKIEATQAQLTQIVADYQCTIKQLERERATLEEKISRTRAYMAPIRRLPSELLRHIFIMNFDEYPCCAWILSSVCSQWRRLALSMPKLWSKVWYPFAVYFPSRFFDVGAFRGSSLAIPEDISAHFPTEPTLYSIALSHLPPVSQSSRFGRMFLGQTGGCVLHVSCTDLSESWLIGHRCVSAKRWLWYHLGWMTLDTLDLPSSFAGTSVPMQ